MTRPAVVASSGFIALVLVTTMAPRAGPADAAFPMPRERGWLTWDVTDIVRSWHLGQPNYGSVMGLDHSFGDHNYVYFYSSESNSPPRLQVAVTGSGQATRVPTVC